MPPVNRCSKIWVLPPFSTFQIVQTTSKTVSSINPFQWRIQAAKILAFILLKLSILSVSVQQWVYCNQWVCVCFATIIHFSHRLCEVGKRQSVDTLSRRHQPLGNYLHGISDGHQPSPDGGRVRVRPFETESNIAKLQFHGTAIGLRDSSLLAKRRHIQGHQCRHEPKLKLISYQDLTFGVRVKRVRHHTSLADRFLLIRRTWLASS